MSRTEKVFCGADKEFVKAAKKRGFPLLGII